MSVAMLLDMASAGAGDRVLVGGRADGLTGADLARAASGAAGLLAGTGAASVAFLGVSGPAFPVALFGAATAGLPFSPLNYRLARDQLLELIAQLDAPVLVADAEYAEVAAATGRPVLSTADLAARAAGAEPFSGTDVEDDDPAVVLYTSGTTSRPKGAILRHRHLVSYVLETVEFASAAPDDAILVSVPPYHVAGVGTVLTNVYSCRRIVYLPDFTAERWLRTAAREAVTNAMVVPTMLARIVDELGGRSGGVESLRAIAYGGARMPRPVLEAALRAFDGVGFTNAYGLTETSSTIAVLGPEDHRAALASDDPVIAARLGSAGRLVPGVEGRIRSEDGTDLPAGSIGELWVRGPQVSGEYLGAGSAVDAEGWFHTRDQASFDADGYLFIAGRSDDTIIKGGENIAPAEIEDVLLNHPAVKEIAVLGLPDDEWGSRIVAAVVPESGVEVSGEELRRFVRGRLRGSRTPDEVVFRTELPYTPTGKLLRRALVEELSR